jgi:integrase
MSDWKASASAGISAVRSLPVGEWPDADRKAWAEATRPSVRLKPGGLASHLAPVSQEDFARRYGAFLGFLQRRGLLNRDAAAGAQVTPETVALYVEELQQRVRSGTVWNCIYKLRRATGLINPQIEMAWLLEIERDIALTVQPRSKFDRVVLISRPVEAGLTLITEAQQFAENDFERAKGIRNGLMIVVLALCPMRIKNFAALEIGRTFRQVNGSWWITIPKAETKTKKPEERRIPKRFNDVIAGYLKESRPLLMKQGKQTHMLWISSQTGVKYTTKNLGTLISKITFQTLGVDVSPHLFRTSAATTSAILGGQTPHLASGVLGHNDPRVTHQHYVRTTGVQAATIFGKIISELRQPKK